MRMRLILSIWLFSLFIFNSTGHAQQAQTYDFPKPFDTKSKQIKIQEKKTWSIGTVQVSNQFDGARLNGFSQKNDSTFTLLIAPENTPVNGSPWYAFKIWSAVPKNVWLEFKYTEAKHRYFPKISTDGKSWSSLDSASVTTNKNDRVLAQLHLSADTLWVAAQEVIPSSQVYQWCRELAQHPQVKYGVAGLSGQGRELPWLDIGGESVQDRDVIVLLSRQHPPEVTGYMAMQAFLKTLLANSPLANAFRKKYRVLVFPLMNPDGVDAGHWRHNSGGVDLNRDWAYYHQPETRQVANFIVRTTKKDHNQVILGIDFHSTFYDVYYTCKEMNSQIPGFKDYWLQGIAASIPDYAPRIEPFEIEQPISKSWFLTQFGAEGITFEIGDDTPRDFIQVKGQAAAIEMMQLLVLRN